MKIQLTITLDAQQLASALQTGDLVLSFDARTTKARATRLSLSSAEYEALYWSGASSRALGREYGVNHNHFNRVWSKQGLDVVRMPSERPRAYKRLKSRKV